MKTPNLGRIDKGFKFHALTCVDLKKVNVTRDLGRGMSEIRGDWEIWLQCDCGRQLEKKMLSEIQTLLEIHPDGLVDCGECGSWKTEQDRLLREQMIVREHERIKRQRIREEIRKELGIEKPIRQKRADPIEQSDSVRPRGRPRLTAPKSIKTLSLEDKIWTDVVQFANEHTNGSVSQAAGVLFLIALETVRDGQKGD